MTDKEWELACADPTQHYYGRMALRNMRYWMAIELANRPRRERRALWDCSTPEERRDWGMPPQ